MKITCEQLLEEIKLVNEYIEIADYDASLFSARLGMDSIDIVYIFLNLEKKYHVNLNDLVKKLKNYSFNELMECINT